MKHLWQKLTQKFTGENSQFMRNLGWLGMSGAAIRVTRLLTTVILARFLSQYDYGLAAIVLTTNEFVRVFTRNGVGIRLIRAEESELESLAQSAYWLNWAVFIGLFIIQCIAAFPLAWFYGDNQLILPICTMSIGLLLIPHGLVQVALIQRENRFRAIALLEMIQISTDNILSLIFAVAGLGMWAIVLPKILVAPIYVPIVFGDKWINAIPVLMLICLSAIPRPFADSASQLLLAIDKPEIDLIWNVLFTGLFAIALFLGVSWQSHTKFAQTK